MNNQELVFRVARMASVVAICVATQRAIVKIVKK